MRNTSHTILPLLLLLTTLFLPACTSAPTLKPQDLDALTGPRWTGTLTYRDYTTNKMTTIPTTLTITRVPYAAPPAWTLLTTYPDEPHADWSQTITLTDNGRTLNDETITARTTLPDGSLRITTTSKGKDNDLPATIRHFYTFAPKALTIRKEVQPQTDQSTKPPFTERNTSRFTR
jgi:hypothetical protein